MAAWTVASDPSKMTQVGIINSTRSGLRPAQWWDKINTLLDDESRSANLVHFSDGKQAQLILYFTQIHCSSCLYILRTNPNWLNEGGSPPSHFWGKKFSPVTISITIRACAKRQETSGWHRLRTTSQFERHPEIQVQHILTSRVSTKIGIAGFCFAKHHHASSFAGPSGHIQNTIDTKLHFVLKFLGIAFVLSRYCFTPPRSSLLRHGRPLTHTAISDHWLFRAALALSITLHQEFVWGSCQGSEADILDSMSCGHCVLVLIGRRLQSRTHSAISLDRDCANHFPNRRRSKHKLSEGQAVPRQKSSKLKEHGPDPNPFPNGNYST